MGWGYNASQYQTQTIQVHTCLSPEDKFDQFFLKMRTIGFFSKALHIHVWSSAFNGSKH